MRKLRIVEYQRVDELISAPVTKFGGQPVWVDTPQWPISRTWGTPMRFICQIVLDPSIFGPIPPTIAYVFLTYFDQNNYSSFDEDAIFVDGGENAVVLQPGGMLDPGIKTEARLTRPTLFDRKGQPVECRIVLEEGEETDKLLDDITTDEDKEYFDEVGMDKIGGTPGLWKDQLAYNLGEGNWKLLLQVDGSYDEPFELHLGGSCPTMYVFLSEDGRTGSLMIDDS